jgi:hypothetical protein
MKFTTDAMVPLYLWLYSGLSEAITGFAHAGMIVLGGAVATGTPAQAPADFHNLAVTCLIGSALRVFNFLDTHPLPKLSFVPVATSAAVPTNPPVPPS